MNFRYSYIKIIIILLFVIVCNSLAASTDSAGTFTKSQQAKLNIARIFYNDKQYNKALSFYQMLLSERPNDTDLLIETAKVDEWAGDHQEALTLLQRVIKLAPQRRNDVIRLMGWQYLALQEPQPALQLFQEYLKQYPNDQDATIGKQQALAALNQVDIAAARKLVDDKHEATLELESKKQTTQVANLTTANPDTDLAIARKYRQSGNYHQALIYYNQALQQDPDNADLLIEVAQVYDTEHQPLPTLKLLNHTMEIAPQRREDIVRLMGWQYVALGEPAKANALFNEYLKTHPADQDSHTGIQLTTLMTARQLAAAGNYKPALKIYFQLLQRQPNNTDLLIETAKVEGWANHYTAAIALYQHALAVNPQLEGQILNPMAWQYLWNNQPQAAEALFKRYLITHPNDLDATLGLAHSLENQNYYKQALGFYNVVIASDYTNLEARYGAARCELNLNHFAAAEQGYQQILLLKPNEVPALAGIAQTHNFENLNRTAAREYQQLVDAGSTDLEVKIGLAQAQYWAGFPDLALATLNEVPGHAAGLRQRVEFDLGNPVFEQYDWSSDSDGLTINSNLVSAGYRFNNNVVLGVVNRLANLSEQGQNVNGDEYWLTLNDRVGSINNPMGTHWPYVGIGARTFNDWQTLAWTVGDKWIPADLWRIYFISGNYVVENIPSIENHIVFTNASLGFDYLPKPRILFALGSEVGNFSDNNIRSRINNRLEYILFYNPRITAVIDDYYFHDSNSTIYNGYYNPEDYVEGRGGLRIQKNITDTLQGAIQGGTGKYKENPGGSGALFYYNAVLFRDFRQYGRLSFVCGHSNSSPGINAQTGGSGYSRSYCTINFGASL